VLLFPLISSQLVRTRDPVGEAAAAVAPNSAVATALSCNTGNGTTCIRKASQWNRGEAVLATGDRVHYFPARSFKKTWYCAALACDLETIRH
jgi:hypothetical protein